MAWSYDLLAMRKSNCWAVFGVRWGLSSKCLRGSRIRGRPLPTYESLDALVRKSLIVAEHSSTRTRFSMLETIREFADEQLGDHGGARCA